MQLAIPAFFSLHSVAPISLLGFVFQAQILRSPPTFLHFFDPKLLEQVVDLKMRILHFRGEVSKGSNFAIECSIAKMY
jgi:hypothetical protein